MANIKSSEKANRQRVTRTARNVAQTTAMRTAIKKVRAAIGSKNAKDARAAAHERGSGDRQGGLEGRHQEGDGLALGLSPDGRGRAVSGKQSSWSRRAKAGFAGRSSSREVRRASPGFRASAVFGERLDQARQRDLRVELASS